MPLAAWIMLGAQPGQSLLVGLSVALALPILLKWQSVPRPLIFLGDASYSLYLGHLLAISIAARFWPHLGFLALAGVAGGLAYYWWVEQVILLTTSKDPPSQRQPAS